MKGEQGSETQNVHFQGNQCVQCQRRTQSDSIAKSHDPMTMDHVARRRAGQREKIRI